MPVRYAGMLLTSCTDLLRNRRIYLYNGMVIGWMKLFSMSTVPRYTRKILQPMPLAVFTHTIGDKTA